MIVTAPTSHIATVYQKELNSLKITLPSLRTCVDIRCVSDPSGRRVGSGGGTLNAIDVAVKAYGTEFMKSSRTLIIHSGGDSKRAPFHSVCGKAWTSINSRIGRTLATPLAILIEELSTLVPLIPTGSVTVASCDVLLDLKPRSQDDMQFKIPEDGVTIIAVPELPSTAKNHGVLVLPSHESQLSDRFSVNIAEHYLQKPSIETMNTLGAIHAQQNFAFIDTGIVILAGTALDAMTDLLKDDVIQKCTDSCQGASGELRLELYSDMLLALKVGSDQSIKKTLEDLFENLGINKQYAKEKPPSNYHYALSLLFRHLCDVRLYVLTVSDGLFCHLGTSKELLELITCSDVADFSISSSFSQSPFSNISKFIALAKKYELTKEVGSLSIIDELREYQITPKTHVDGFKINSIISISEDYELSSDALVEHSLLTGNFQIGAGSVVSHVNADVGEDLVLLSGMMVQQVLIHTNALDGEVVLNDDCPTSSSFAFLLLGIKDDVKATYLNPSAHICGISWTEFLSKTCLTVDEIWPSITSDEDRTLWTASLFPCIDICRSSSASKGEYIITSGNIVDVKYILAWMQYLSYAECSGLSFPFDLLKTSIEIWKSCRRCSLSDLMKIGDASKMHGWRRHMSLTVEHLKPTGEGSELNMDFIYGKGRAVALSATRVFDISTSCALKLKSIITRKIESAHVHLKKRNFVWELLLILTIFYLCSPDIIKLSEESADEGSNVSGRIGEIIYDVLRLSGIDLIDGSVVQEIFFTFTDVMKALNGGDSTFVNARDTLHGLNLFMSSLIDHGGIKSIELTILIAPKLLELICAEFQPRFLLLHSWLVKHGECKLPSHSSILNHGISELARCPPVDTINLGIKEIGIRMVSEMLKKVARNFQKAVEESNFPILSRLHQNVYIDRKEHLSVMIESWSQSLISKHVQFSLHEELTGNVTSVSIESIQKAIQDDNNIMVISRSPVRVDLMGGWSDTPPCSYETTGAVLNAAILVDGQYPIHAIARYIDEPTFYLKSIKETHNRLTGKSEHNIFERCTICKLCDFDDASDPSASCGLLKAALIALGVKDVISSYLFNFDSTSNAMNQNIISLFGGRGLEIVCISGLPAGSGMGGSSVLAAAILKATSELLGVSLSPKSIIFLTSRVEQIMTTGGGWQDQLGAIYGGLKIGRSERGLPIRISCEQLTMPKELIRTFERRTCLIYTGKQRLAKDTLINALRKTSMTPVDLMSHVDTNVVSVVKRLTNSAEAAYKKIQEYSLSASESSADEAMDYISGILQEYWSLKKQMAAGSEPSCIRDLFTYLSPLCSGWSLCGAGAGGFAIIIIKRDTSFNDVRLRLEEYNSEMEDLSLHEVSLDSMGVHAKIYNGESTLKFTTRDISFILDMKSALI